MTDFYIIVLVLLFVLAISDLIVGVSNDAVNFLNSAIGSKVTSRRNIMIVASAGILVGATFSSGMMEVARKGIFNPDFFYFSEIMVIFIAVMITDIILLDLFNTFGMPTSTTVSIVFELLGAAVAVSILKIMEKGDTLGTLDNYINSSSALIIISGIFLSVLIAFAVGSIVQYFSRLLFTFNLNKKFTWVNYLWCGLALTALAYFLLIKGIKGASFVPVDFVATVQEQTLTTMCISAVFWTFTMFILNHFFKVNILKIVVLFGTFALAMAFSGNDLVNFIGVPIAGFESFLAWRDSGVDADSYSMSILLQPIQSKTYMLVIAGLVMIVTLWFSKKARSVTETEVNLGRQSEGDERFRPNVLSKKIVRYTIAINKQFNYAIPDTWLDKSEKRFEPHDVLEVETKNAPAFDLVRASVNLTVASILIAFATSLKLPLSTTYVSFMVAMGTSLSDKAWGRNSAVFRVAGVINVIGGWFVTAILAFTASATFAILIYYFEIKAIALLVLAAVFLISRTFLLHKRKEKEKHKRLQLKQADNSISFSESIDETAVKVANTLENIKTSYNNALEGLLKEDLTLLKASAKGVESLKKEQEDLKYQLYNLIKRFEDHSSDSGRLYILVYDLVQDIVQSISLISETCLEHVSNSLDPIQKSYGEQIKDILEKVSRYLENLISIISKKEFNNLGVLKDEKNDLLKSLEETLATEINNIKHNSPSKRNSLLVITILLESKDLIAVAIRFAKLYNRIALPTEDSNHYFISKAKK
ncbi:inorganic phosphate transporter [Winogradskyella sp.]|uniref:inorganic phosphate transporter n=1 Tax=Winogradskyella sp. TaxID=1883156 RepID=UPI00261412EE|nr:inorganic phosphate transporter [Winogradskyella sp.]